MKDLNPSKTVRRQTGCGKMYVTFVYEGEKIVGILPILGKTGECSMAIMSVVQTVIEALQGHTIDMREIGNRFVATRCHKDTVAGHCCVHELGTAIIEMTEPKEAQ